MNAFSNMSGAASNGQVVLALLHSDRKSGSRLQQLLHRNGYSVKLFRVGGRLLSWLSGNRVESVLVDIARSEKGPKNIARVRERFPITPILALADGCEAESLARSIHFGANHFVLDSTDQPTLLKTLERLINFRMEYLRYIQVIPHLQTTIETHLPTRLELLGGTVFYLTEEMFKHGIITLSQINIKVAIVEALTNAMEHGNKLDASKQVFIHAAFSHGGARIEITDEGPGFDYRAIPDPTRKENIFSPRGRGIYMMRRFLDEVIYTPPGNKVTLIKKRVAEQVLDRPYPWERRML